MAIQLMEAVQKRLGLPPLVKVTPNKDVSAKKLPGAPFHQVALVAVAAALYKVSRTNEGCVRLLMSGKNENWLDLDEAYGKRMPAVIDRINSYGVADPLATEQLMRKMADACLLIIHEELASHINTDTVREFMSGQRHDILVFMPADLQLGKFFNDNVWDDQTNHMEGPVSNLMHKIENLFS
jgi:hypothetical protein